MTRIPALLTLTYRITEAKNSLESEFLVVLFLIEFPMTADSQHPISSRTQSGVKVDSYSSSSDSSLRIVASV